LQQELRAGDYRPQPLLRVWIPKSNGGQRPLGVPTRPANCTSAQSDFGVG
jgi:retron-type reverse transcriptase